MHPRIAERRSHVELEKLVEELGAQAQTVEELLGPEAFGSLE